MRKLLATLRITGPILCATTRADDLPTAGAGRASITPLSARMTAKRALGACDMTGSYLTEDGGASWRMFNLGGTTRFFEWDPNNAKVIYAGSNGLYRSADGGKSWS